MLRDSNSYYRMKTLGFTNIPSKCVVTTNTARLTWTPKNSLQRSHTSR